MSEPMVLPAYVLDCVDALESAGFSAYAVGGCVRDALLDLTPQDYDLCTDALPQQLRQVFAHRRLVLAGEKHGTVTVLTEGGPVEITTFRLEGDYTDSRHPSWVRFVDDIHADLSRRDFTVNAMAWSPRRGFQDPFGGREDLRQGVLRAVGDPPARFTEDALRILRGVRFSVRYGLRPEARTLDAMISLSPLLDRLARERVMDELCKLLPLLKAENVLHFAPVLVRAVPELAPLVGFDQRTPHHAYDLLTHTAHVVAAVPPSPTLRWAALLHDIGKPHTLTLDAQGQAHYHGHASVGAEMADGVLRRLKAPTALREQVVALIKRHMTPLEPDKRLLRRSLGKHGAQAVLDLLALQRADSGSKGTENSPDRWDRVQAAIDELLSETPCLTLKDLAVNGRDLMALGISPGPGLGRCLEALLKQVQEELLPNEREALLSSSVVKNTLSQIKNQGGNIL